MNSLEFRRQEQAAGDVDGPAAGAGERDGAGVGHVLCDDHLRLWVRLLRVRRNHGG